MRRDCVHKTFNLNICVKLQKTSETSKSFENNILSRAIQTAFEINIKQFFITVVGTSSHMLGNKKVKHIMFHRGFYEITLKASNFQEHAKIISQYNYNHCFSKGFEDHECNFRAKDYPCYGRTCMLQLIFIKPSGR